MDAQVTTARFWYDVIRSTPGRINIETAWEGRTSTQSFAAEEIAAEYERRAARLGATTRRTA